MSNIFFLFWRRAGFALAIAAMLFCYTALPDSIAIQHDDAGNPVAFTDKQTFFYWSAAILVGFNLLVGALRDATLKLNFKKLNPASKWANHPTQLKNLLRGWFDAQLAFINTFLVFVFLGLYNINSNKGQRLDFNYNWLLLIGGFMLLFILFYLPIKLLYTNPSDDVEEDDEDDDN